MYTVLPKSLGRVLNKCDLKNRKHFPCFNTVVETRVWEVWEGEKLKWEHEPV